MEQTVRKKLLFRFLLVHFALILFGLVFLFLSKTLTSFFPNRECVMVRLLGLYCPGCGGTRGMRHLVALHLKEAFLSYPPLFLALGIWVWFDLKYLSALWKNNPSALPRLTKNHVTAVVGAVLLFFVLRNIGLCFGYDYLGDILG